MYMFFYLKYLLTSDNPSIVMGIFYPWRNMKWLMCSFRYLRLVIWLYCYNASVVCQPTKHDKTEFRAALQHAAAGHLPVRMWLFYEFVVYHGELEGNQRLDKDLFFYCEVLKFKVSLILCLGIAIPELVFQSRDSGLTLPGSRDPGSVNPFVNHARSGRYWLQ